MMTCLDELGRKEQRTVYRLTLVSGWNTDELDNYARLILRARPHFIEIKVCRTYFVTVSHHTNFCYVVLIGCYFLWSI